MGWPRPANGSGFRCRPGATGARLNTGGRRPECRGGICWEGRRAEGQVLWASLPGTPTGGTPHGLSFTELHPTHEALLQELLHALALAPHAASRLPLDLPVHCQVQAPAGPAFPGRTLNVGRGGLAVQLPAVLEAGAEVVLTLHAARRPLTVEAVIAWVEATARRLSTGPITDGLQFTGLDWALARTLGALLMELR